MSVIPALGRLRQKDAKFKSSWVYPVRFFSTINLPEFGPRTKHRVRACSEAVDIQLSSVRLERIFLDAGNI